MNHYECLKVTPDAPTEVIRAAYRALAGKRHPDRQGGAPGLDDETHREMVAINAAYEVLIKPDLRAEYDAMLAAKAKAKPASSRSSSSKAIEAALPERGNGFSETRVDVDWMTPKTVAFTPLWPLTGTRKYIAIGLGGLLLIAVISTAWDVVSRHQMDKALSQQYSANTTPAAADVDAAEQLAEPPPGLTVPKPLEPAPSAADTEVPLTPEEVLAKQRGGSASAASGPDVPPPSFERQPTVTELSKLTDEQLMAILPSLGELQPAKGSFSRQVNRASHHPLDGKPLNLRTDKQLIDPLSPDSIRH